MIFFGLRGEPFVDELMRLTDVFGTLDDDRFDDDRRSRLILLYWYQAAGWALYLANTPWGQNAPDRGAGVDSSQPL